MAIKRCTQAFATAIDGQPVVFTTDKLFDENDPVYKGLNAEQRRIFFEDVETYTERRAVRQTETATAAPGESRNVTRRRGKASDA